MADHPVGLRRLTNGQWQAYTTVHGKFLSKVFKPDTPRSVMTAWRERARAIAKFGTPKDTGQTFAEDADDYLAMVRGMPTYQDRAYRIQQWVDVFGHRQRSTLTSAEIRQQLELWRKTGRYDGGRLSVGSLNTRRTALQAMFTALDGRSEPNIVRDVPAYDERDSYRIRALPLITVAQIIRRLRPWGKMRARLRVLMWTGWPHALLKSVTPDDIDWQRGRVRLERRKKGKGMPPAWVPVLPPALRALRRMAKLNAWGRFSNSSLHSAVARAVTAEDARRAAIGLPPIGHFRTYDVRHSFATWAASRIRDDRALKELLRTNSIARYTEGSVADRLADAVQVLQASTGRQASVQALTAKGRDAKRPEPAKGSGR